MKLVLSKYKIRCEIGRCKNYAEYELMPETSGHQSSIFICKDCLEAFYLEAAQFIVPKSPKNIIAKAMEARQDSIQTLSAVLTEQTGNSPQESPAEPAPEINSEKPVDCAPIPLATQELNEPESLSCCDTSPLATQAPSEPAINSTCTQSPLSQEGGRGADGSLVDTTPLQNFNSTRKTADASRFCTQGVPASPTELPSRQFAFGRHIFAAIAFSPDTS